MSSIVIFVEKKAMAEAIITPFKSIKREFSWIELEPCETFPTGATITWGHPITFLLGILLESDGLGEKELEKVKNLYRQEPLNYLLDLENLTVKDIEKSFGSDARKYLVDHLRSIISLFKSSDILINASSNTLLDKILFDMVYKLAEVKDKKVQHFNFITLVPEEINEKWKKPLIEEMRYEPINTDKFNQVIQFLETVLK